MDREIIENVDLPGLTVEDIETVLLEHSEWPGSQIGQFLQSEVDYDIEAKLFSMEGYESDSGYSTYNVHPITSSAPMQLNGESPVNHTPSLSPALTLIDSTSMLSVNLSPTNPSFYHAPIPTHPESANSPSSDISFFSPTAMFTPFSSSTASQENFSPVQSFSFFTTESSNGSSDTTANELPLNLQLAPNLVDPARNNLESLLSMCSKMPDLNNLLASSNNPSLFLVAINTALSTLTKPHRNSINENFESANSGAESNLAPLQSLVTKLGLEQLHEIALDPKVQPGQLSSCTNVASNCHPSLVTSTPQVAGLPAMATISNDQLSNCRSIPLSSCINPIIDMTQHPKGQQQKPRLHRTSRPVAMKTQKKKSRWPRSLSKANLMAFREHILNKLKKSSDDIDTTEDNILTAGSIQLEGPLVNCDTEMKFQRSHPWCHSEPADITDCNVPSPSEESPAASPQRHSQPARVSSPAATTSGRQSQVSDIVSQASPASIQSNTVGIQFLDSSSLHGNVESLTAQLNGHTSIRPHLEQNLDSAKSTCGLEPFDICF